MIPRSIFHAALAVAFSLAPVVTTAIHASPRSVRVAADGRSLETGDGRPFFYLADTVWELLHRLDRAETEKYLQDRASKGFNVIQTVALAELDGLRQPNANGDLPLIDLDPTRPNEPYWQHVDWVVRRANELGFTVGLLPTWGDKWNIRHGIGPEIFNVANARAYGEWIGRRYADADIIWILGGDRPLQTEDHWEITRAMAAGVRAGDGGRRLITFHPGGNQNFLDRLHAEPWLDFAMFQSGHTYTALDNYRRISELRQLEPVKPVMDSEPCYELFWVRTNAWRRFHRFRFDDFQPRRAAWWSALAGACGYTFGNDSIWQCWEPSRTSKNLMTVPWHEALDLPGASQPQHLARLLEDRGLIPLVPTPRIVLDQPADPGEHIASARSNNSRTVVAYTPTGEPFTLDLSSLPTQRLGMSWLDPRTGARSGHAVIERGASIRFETPLVGEDWALVIEARDGD